MQTFAIVDIETTGGSADQSGITEIAIRIWDGVQVIDQFSSLINPETNIPLNIQALTGIHPDMVKNAPIFKEIAPVIFKILEGSVFVAHNVHFDYSFIHNSLLKSGFELKSQKLCTVRLSRKILPGIPSYSLGKLTNYLSIPHLSRHRADGDVEATVLLFKKLQESDKLGIIQKSLKQESSLGKFPSLLNPEDILNLPECPGVYYFKNEKGKIIYVGKAKNIKKRVFSHFSNNSIKKQRQDFVSKVRYIHSEPLGTELMALIYESHEIKRLWPELNRAQKNRDHAYGIFEFKDQNGFSRLGIDKLKLNLPPVFTFSTYLKGLEILRYLCEEFNLNPNFCFLKKRGISENLMSIIESIGDRDMNLLVKDNSTNYNEKVANAIDFLRQNRSFAILGRGLEINQQSLILILNGEWLGIGFIPYLNENDSILMYKDALKPLKINGFIRNTLFEYANLNPEKIIPISEETIINFKLTSPPKKSKKIIATQLIKNDSINTEFELFA